MKTIKELIKYICLLGIMAFCVWFGYEAGETAHKYPEPFTPRLMSIIELQEFIGAEPDGVVGPETIRLWDEAYANQESAQFMTPSGGKE